VRLSFGSVTGNRVRQVPVQPLSKQAESWPQRATTRSYPSKRALHRYIGAPLCTALGSDGGYICVYSPPFLWLRFNGISHADVHAFDSDISSPTALTGMYRYSVFGGILESSFIFPELLPAAPAPSVASWTVTRRDAPEPLSHSRLVGKDDATPDLPLRLIEADDRYRLDYGSLGVYDVMRDGGGITWSPGEHDCVNCARQCILGRVLALAIRTTGGFCLHASCVALAGGAVAFLAPKGTGKSTLASALVGHGATLVTDDMLRVQVTSPPLVYTGVQRLRLRSDSAAAAAELGITSHPATDGKHITEIQGTISAVSPSFPLAAIYVLRPLDRTDSQSPFRKPLAGAEALIPLVSNTMLASLVAGSSPDMLMNAAKLASRVAVYELWIPRNYARLADAAESLMNWHDAGARVVRDLRKAVEV